MESYGTPSTTGRAVAADRQRPGEDHRSDLSVAVHWDEHPHGGLWIADLSVDGSPVGATSFLWDDENPEVSLADLADRLCESFLHEEVWGGWPICPRHGSRPMWATVGDDGVAVWACEEDPERDRVRIGRLGV